MSGFLMTARLRSSISDSRADRFLPPRSVGMSYIRLVMARRRSALEQHLEHDVAQLVHCRFRPLPRSCRRSHSPAPSSRARTRWGRAAVNSPRDLDLRKPAACWRSRTMRSFISSENAGPICSAETWNGTASSSDMSASFSVSAAASAVRSRRPRRGCRSRGQGAACGTAGGRCRPGRRSGSASRPRRATASQAPSPDAARAAVAGTIFRPASISCAIWSFGTAKSRFPATGSAGL